MKIVAALLVCLSSFGLAQSPEKPTQDSLTAHFIADLSAALKGKTLYTSADSHFYVSYEQADKELELLSPTRVSYARVDSGALMYKNVHRDEYCRNVHASMLKMQLAALLAGTRPRVYTQIELVDIVAIDEKGDIRAEWRSENGSSLFTLGIAHDCPIEGDASGFSASMRDHIPAELSVQEIQQVKAGDLVPGMRDLAVRQMMGEPERTMDFGWQNQKQYVYKDGHMRLFMKNGRLDNFTANY